MPWSETGHIWLGRWSGWGGVPRCVSLNLPCFISFARIPGMLATCNSAAMDEDIVMQWFLVEWITFCLMHSAREPVRSAMFWSRKTLLPGIHIVSFWKNLLEEMLGMGFLNIQLQLCNLLFTQRLRDLEKANFFVCPMLFFFKIFWLYRLICAGSRLKYANDAATNKSQLTDEPPAFPISGQGPEKPCILTASAASKCQSCKPWEFP